MTRDGEAELHERLDMNRKTEQGVSSKLSCGERALTRSRKETNEDETRGDT